MSLILSVIWIETVEQKPDGSCVFYSRQSQHVQFDPQKVKEGVEGAYSGIFEVGNGTTPLLPEDLSILIQQIEDLGIFDIRAIDKLSLTVDCPEGIEAYLEGAEHKILRMLPNPELRPLN